MKHIKYLILALSLTTGTDAFSVDVKPHAATTQKELDYILEGNKLYNQQRYAQAEQMYRKALESAPASDAAKYNLAAALMHQTVYADGKTEGKPIDEAKALLNQSSHSNTDKGIAEKSYYNLGNINFLEKNFAGAVDAYKNALRINPENEATRQNLMLALKELEKQQQNQNNQNQDQNKDQDKDKDKDQNKDNKDQKENQDNKDNQNQDQNNQNQQQQQQQPRQGGISDANAEKILKTMENEEAMTRKRVEGQKSKEKKAGVRITDKPW